MAVCLFAPWAGGQTRTLRIVTYNIAADTDGFSKARPGLIAPPSNTNDFASGGVLEGIGEQILGNDPAQPIDILALQEVTSNAQTISQIVSALNTYYNAPGKYAMSTLVGGTSGGVASGGGPSALVYNTTTVQLVASVGLSPPPGTSLGFTSGMYRQVLRYEFAPAGVAPAATNRFYMYVSHYKSGTGAANEAARNGEAQIIRNNSATLPATARILYVGDLNTGIAAEAMYQTLVAPGTNQALDPINPLNDTNLEWDLSDQLETKTFSPTGIHYRDDYQMMTTNVYYGAPNGLKLVPGTYHVFGNNGSTPFLGSVNSGGNTALTNLAPGSPITAAQLRSYLTTASDHLPVVADYTVPVPVPVPGANFTGSPLSGAWPLTVVFTNLSTNATSYAWAFGDSGTSGQTNISHTYTEPGIYTVSLTAIGPGGFNNFLREDYIVVTNPLAFVMYNAGVSGGGSFQFAVSNRNGAPITVSQMSFIKLYATTNLTVAFTNWTLLTNVGSLTNGVLQIKDTNSAVYPRRFYRATQSP